jgi:hypothetical protein
MNSKTILIVVVVAFLALSMIGLIFGEDTPDEPAGPSQEEQMVMEYFDEHNISYGEIETDDTMVSAYIDTQGLTSEDVYYAAYDLTDWKIAQEDSVYVTVYIYNNATAQQLAEGHYDGDVGRIVVE